jgi:fluoride exporter
MFQLLSIVIVACVLGTLIRWGAGSSLWALLAVNAAGSLIAGFIAGSDRLDALWATAILIGLCGSLTTFSGFALQMVKLIQQGEIFKMALHFTLNNALCLLLCYSGWTLAQTKLNS